MNVCGYTSPVGRRHPDERGAQPGYLPCPSASLIRRLGQGEPTVLLSSHLLGVVEQICDRVGVISHGRLVRESTVKELRGSAGVLVRARPGDLARQMLTEMFGPEAVGQVDGALRVSTRPRAGLS